MWEFFVRIFSKWRSLLAAVFVVLWPYLFGLLRDELVSRGIELGWERFGGPKVIADALTWVAVHPLQSVASVTLAWVGVAAFLSERHVRRRALSPPTGSPELSEEEKRKLDGEALIKLLGEKEPESSTLAMLAKMGAKFEGHPPQPGVTFTGGEFQREHGERLLDDEAKKRSSDFSDQVLNSISDRAQEKLSAILTVPIEVFLVSNGVGGTPGIHIKAVNQSANPLMDSRMVVTDFRRWDEKVRAFVTSPEIHGSDVAFNEMEIGNATLHPGTPELLAFVRATDGRLTLSGNSKNGSREARTTRYGIWQISYRIGPKNSMTKKGQICFRWDEGVDGKAISPTPWDCPKASFTYSQIDG